MLENFLIFFTPIVYTCVAMFAFVVIAKLSMPYSKGALMWLNKLSYKKIFVRGVAAFFIVFCSFFAISHLFTRDSVQIEVLIIPLALGSLVGIVIAGMFIAILRYSYEYIADNEFENK